MSATWGVAAFGWMAIGVMLIAIHNQDTEDDLSPLIRDARPGEPRYWYYGTQFVRCLAWPVGFVIVSVILIPKTIQYLREPMEEDSA